MDTTSSKSIVEVSVDSAAGRKALGIMNMRQALELPDLPLSADAQVAQVVHRRDLFVVRYFKRQSDRSPQAAAI